MEKTAVITNWQGQIKIFCIPVSSFDIRTKTVRNIKKKSEPKKGMSILFSGLEKAVVHPTLFPLGDLCR